MSQSKGKVCVVVLGDIGRSPRMQYHASSFAEEGYDVTLVGYSGSQPIEMLRSSPRVTFKYIWSCPEFKNYLPTVLAYLLKVIWQVITLFITLLFSGCPDFLLVQNPPAVPSLGVCYFYCKIFRAKFIIDWHNYAYSILALSLTRDHKLVRISEWFEFFFGRTSDGNLCVTKAMRDDLLELHSIEAVTFYDRPPNIFKTVANEDMHPLFTTLGFEYDLFLRDCKNNETIFTKLTDDLKVVLKDDRPGLVISSTSWTEDEDFSILLTALEEYEKAKEATSNLPALVCVITGKGPLKEFYMNIIKRKNWKYVEVITPWLEGELFLANLTADEVQIDSNLLSGTNLSDLIDISKNGSCFSNGNFIFEQDELKVNNLNVAKINSVPVEDYFSKGRNSKQRFPDVIIVEGNFTAYDIEDRSRTFSLLDIYKNGLKLDQEVIDSEFQFSNLNVNNLIVEKINNVSVDSWVLEDLSEPVYIKGQKVFSEVKILNKSRVHWLDGIDVEELERQAMRIKERSDISGNRTFESIICYNVTAKSIRLGGKNLSDVINSPERIIITGNLIADKMAAEELNVNGTIDGISWDDMLNDSIYKGNDTEYIVSGEKIINGRLVAVNFNLSGSLNDMTFEEFFEFKPKDPVQIVLAENVTLNTILKMDNLIFEGMLDSVKSENFGNEWLLKDGDQVIYSPLRFQNVELKSGCILKNKVINRINITDLIENTLRIDENATVTSLQAMNIIAKNVEISGTVNGAKFRDAVVQSESNMTQIIDGHWLFNHDLIVNGNLIVEGFLSGLNVSHLCSVKMDEEDEVSVIVGGSVKFEHEPEIQETINGINISDVTAIMTQAVRILTTEMDLNKEISTIEPHPDFFGMSYKVFLFDLAKQIISDSEVKDEEELPWMRTNERLSKYKCKRIDRTFESLNDYVIKKVLILFGFRQKVGKESLIVRWSRKKRDHVDELLVSELQEEESQWTRYDKDQVTVKNEVTTAILDTLIDDTVQVLVNIFNKKKAAV